MAAGYGSNSVQTVAPGGFIVFTEASNPCKRGFVRHREGTGSFVLAGKVLRNTCGCYPQSADYFVDFGANIGIPTGGTPGEISVAFVLDGITIPSSTIIVTPAAVEEYFNVSRAIDVPVWAGCCQTFGIQNTSDQDILVQNANIVFERPDLAMTR